MIPQPANLNFHFSCTTCGDCCRGRQEVALNLDDLQLIAKFQNLANTRGLFDNGIATARKNESGYWRPYLRFRTRPMRMCPFLNNELMDNGQIRGLCRLHPQAKPLVCHLAPLGRIIDLKTGDENWQVYEPSPGCPGMGQGPALNLNSEIQAFRQRLNCEAEFFAFLEQNSPNCPDQASAIQDLFSHAVN